MRILWPGLLLFAVGCAEQATEAVSVATPTAAPVATMIGLSERSLPHGPAPWRGPAGDRAPTSAELELEAELNRWGNAYRTAIADHVQRLLARGDAASLFRASRLLPLTRELEQPGATEEDQTAFHEGLNQESMDLLRRARQLAQDDPLLAWHEAMECHGHVAGCDAAAAIADVVRLDPDNAAGALLALERAHREGNLREVDNWLARAADAKGLDVRYGELGMSLETALEPVPVPPRTGAMADELAQTMAPDRTLPLSDADIRVVLAGGVVAAQSLPSFQGLMSLCAVRQGVMPATPRLPDCRRVLQHMAYSDTFLAQHMALPQLIQLARHQDERRRWQEHYRQQRWVMSEAGRTMTLEAFQSTWLLSETEAYKAHLSRLGLSMPPHWLPDDERGRALITSGRPPPGS